MTRRPALVRFALPIALLASATWAQDHSHPSADSMQMGDMPGMDADMAMPASAATVSAPVATPARHGTMHDSTHAGAATPSSATQPGVRAPATSHEHAASRPPAPVHSQDMPAMGPMPAMPMPAMQQGVAPPTARDPDYSAGMPAGSVHAAMQMEDRPEVATVRIDQWEAFNGSDGHGQQWDVQGGYGGDYEKLWLRTEGERRDGRLEDGSLEVLWSHAVAPFWNTQLGLRGDAGEGPGRRWLAFGLQGLAPYWFELELTGYAGAAGRTAARVKAEYELLFTQRLVLQPELEINAYGKADPERGVDSGVSDAALGLRLRYELRRQFAPYVGLVWTRRFGATADLARTQGQGAFERQWVAGVRVWF